MAILGLVGVDIIPYEIQVVIGGSGIGLGMICRTG